MINKGYYEDGINVTALGQDVNNPLKVVENEGIVTKGG